MGGKALEAVLKWGHVADLFSFPNTLKTSFKFSDNNMLIHLSIRDFVIVDSLDMEFGPGFTVLTGETGAGKSILIDALALVLGERADVSFVRAGADRTEIAAEFDIAREPAVREWLEENDLAGDPDQCLVRRVVESGGRSRGFVNGRAATMQQLRELGERLVDIHGQHAHQSLLRSDAQRDLLDAYGGLRELRAEVAARYRHWQDLHRRRQERAANAAGLAAEREQLQWRVRELRELRFSVEEWPEIQAEHGRLANSAALMEGAQGGLETLSEGDGSCQALLSAVISRLSHLTEFDSRLKEILELLDPAAIQLQEAAYSLRHYLQGLDMDPGRLSELEQRLDVIHSCARKYRVNPEELPGLLAEAEARLGELGSDEEDDALMHQEAEARGAYMQVAHQLSEGRQAAGKALSDRVSAAMQDLAMTGGCFEVSLVPSPDGTAAGLEQVEFLVSAHAAIPPRPLAKVASGGELSRISLSIQVITSKISLVPTLIFDEVDVGIGGRVAEIVGQMLRDLGSERQVLCITHLPQVAAQGQCHWRVSKSAGEHSVVSRIDPLGQEQRIEEIARMLGGVDITETTRRHAAEMLGFV